MYPKSIYKDGTQRVVFCGEEHDARKADGWSDSAPVRLPPTIEEVLAAGYSPERAASIVAEEQEYQRRGAMPYGPNPRVELPILDPRSSIGESAVDRRHESAETPIASADDTASTISTAEPEVPPASLANPIQKLRTRKA